MRTLLILLSPLALKAAGVVPWSWWWVTAYLWVPLAVLAIGLAAAIAFFGLLFFAFWPQGE